MIKVGLISLGCAKNLVDSEIMVGHLHKAGMRVVPDAVEADVVIVNTCSFIDSSKEEIAIEEARKMRVPIVAVVDTNGDPDNVDYPIPGNDDAVRAIELFASKVAESIVEGKKNRISKELLAQKKGEAAQPEEASAGEAEPDEKTDDAA